MREADLVVVGGGLAGLFAAVTAADRGRRTILLAAGSGALAFGAGTIDVLGAIEGGPVSGFADGFPRLRAGHPYARLGQETVAAALECFLRVCRQEGYEYHGDLRRNGVALTAAGTRKPVGLYPRTMDAGPLAGAPAVGVVRFQGLEDYVPRLMAGAAAPGSPPWRTLEVDLRPAGPVARPLTALDVAHALDAPEGRAALVRQLRQLRPALAPGEVLVVPPVLGTAPSYAVAEELERELRCRLVEVAGTPPAVTGLRLQRLLGDRARRLGVDVQENALVTGARVEAGRCRALVVSDGRHEREVAAARFVLATGGFLGGGLVAEPGRVRESVFGLPVDGPASPAELGAAELFDPGGQPFARLGVSTNGSLQPLDPGGAVVLENVRIAGRALGGYDGDLEKSGNGVAVASGFCAGTLS